MKGRPPGGLFACAPCKGTLLRVQDPPGADQSERRETQLHEGDRVWGVSAERSVESMNRNQIEGAGEQGEWASSRVVLVTKARWRGTGGCATKECVLARGALASRLKGRRTLLERFGWVRVARGDAERDPDSEEACGPPHQRPDAGSARPKPGDGTFLEAALTRENL